MVGNRRFVDKARFVLDLRAHVVLISIAKGAEEMIVARCFIGLIILSWKKRNKKW